MSLGCTTPIVSGVDVNPTPDAQRFHAQTSTQLPFLTPDKIRDAELRRPGELGYDASTVHIPPSWFKSNNVTEGRRQWWEIKAQNYDAVLLFKMGKFYEVWDTCCCCSWPCTCEHVLGAAFPLVVLLICSLLVLNLLLFMRECDASCKILVP